MRFQNNVRSFLVVFVLGFTCFCFAQKKLVILGDSLTEGYGVAKDKAFPTLLEKKIKEAKKDWIVINAGISGSTSASGEPRMKWVLRSKPDLVVLALGSNDALRGFKVEDIRKNIQNTIQVAKAAQLKLVLAGFYAPPNYGEEYGKQFRKIYEDLAKKNNLIFIPFLLQNVAGKPDLNLADGIHPNEKGHEVIAKTVFEILKKQL